MESAIEVTTSLTDDEIQRLKVGDRVLLTGRVYGARDAVHKRFIELLDRGQPLPIDLRNEVLFYVGPTPAPPGRPVGAVGPTTSSRMDSYTPRLLDEGLKGTIGKGPRAAGLCDAYARAGAIHFAATGGAAALLSQSVVEFEVVAYPELGPEALMRFQLEGMPVVVAIDAAGRNIYERG